jgi:hypothetical protein
MVSEAGGSPLAAMQATRHEYYTTHVAGDINVVSVLRHPRQLAKASASTPEHQCKSQQYNQPL